MAKTVILFLFSVLSQLLSDRIFKSCLEHCSFLEIIFASNLIIFLGLFLIKRKVIFSFQMVLRGFLTFVGFYLTTSIFSTLSILEISAMYYSISVITFLILWFIYREKIEIVSLLFCLFSIGIIIINGRNIPLKGFIGCFCFAFLDILTKYSKKLDLLVEICSITFYVAIFSMIKLRSISFKMFNYGTILVAFLSIFSQLILFYSLKKEKIQNLAPFKFIDLVAIMIYEKQNLYQVIILLGFMSIQLLKSISKRKKK